MLSMDGNNGDGSKEAKFNGKVQNSESSSRSKDGAAGKSELHRLPTDGEDRKAESISQSKDLKVGKADSFRQSKDGKPEPISQSTDDKAGNGEKPRKKRRLPQSKKKPTKPKTSGVAKLRGRFTNFGIAVKKLWDVWGRFKAKNTTDPDRSAGEKTLGVPGFEEIACIEAEVPDIMMMDKDRVRTSCKECMKDLPTFPTKEQIKAKLIAADRYYGVSSPKTKRELSDMTLEHEADYYDSDGKVVRPSWRFILERPLVEQYVLMTNYIRKVSVMSELKEDNLSTKSIEEEDSGSDTEYKKFEQKFIRERQELLKPFKKPKSQDIAVQTTFEPKQGFIKGLKECFSEISLYPESEESSNSPEASAVTIVTSRDYSSPLQSDLDGKTTDKSTSCKDNTTGRSTSHKDGNWWESQAMFQPSESFPTSYDSINKNSSSGTDGQSIPVHSAWGQISLQPVGGEFCNDSDSRLVPHNRNIEPGTHRKPKDKKVSFSSVVTYYHGPDKNTAVNKFSDDQDTKKESDKGSHVEPIQLGLETNLPGNLAVTEPPDDQMTVIPGQVTPTENEIIVNPPEYRILVNPLGNIAIEGTPVNKEELPHSTGTATPKQLNRKINFGHILQYTNKGQIVSVSLPAECHTNRILHNTQLMNVVVSRPPRVNQTLKKIHFQEFEEIPDVEYSDPKVSTVKERTDANIQTKIPVAEKIMYNFKVGQSKQASPIEGPVDYQTSQNPVSLRVGNIPPTQLMPNVNRLVTSHNLETEILKNPRESSPPQQPSGYQTLRNLPQSNIKSAASNSPTAQKIKIVSPAIPHKPETKIPNAAASSLGRLAHEREESAGTNTNNQSAPLRMIKARPRSESPKRTQKKFEDDMTTPIKMKIRSDTSVQQVPFPLTTPTTHISTIPQNNPNIIGKTHTQQQQSTDTEGSSTSNEHLKLRPSPACFFRVATPTDLSRISVDEFYPDVPEIDAELSHTCKIKTSHAPHVEIVFANKKTALQFTQEAELPKITRTEETTTLQRFKNPRGGHCNDSDKGRTIASPRVRTKADEGNTETRRNEGEYGYKDNSSRKAPIKNASQQSSITQKFDKKPKIAKLSQTEVRADLKNTPSNAQTVLVKTDPGTAEIKHGKLQDVEVNQTVQPKEIKSTKTPIAQGPKETKTWALPNFLQNECNVIVTNQQQNISAAEPKESKRDLSTPPEKCNHLADSCRKYEDSQSYKITLNKKNEIGHVQGETEKQTAAGKPEQLAKSDDNLVTSEYQVGSIPDLGNPRIFHGRAKLYTRTLSSLTEETSSAVETTSSSAPEKLIDMPVMGRSLEQLKTIFEKKPLILRESEADDRHCDNLSSTGLSLEKCDIERPTGKLVSAELTALADDTIKIPILSNSRKEISSNNSQECVNSHSKQNRPLEAEMKKELPKARGIKHSKSIAVYDDKSERPSSYSGNDEAKNTPLLIQEDSSIQQLGQIDVIKASEIYSNTSMYFLSSEGRVAKLTKVRTVFQPMTLHDDLDGRACSMGSACSGKDDADRSSTTDPIPSKDPSEKIPEIPESVTRSNNDSKLEALCLKAKTDHAGRPSQGLTAKTKSTTDDTSHNSEAKQWLMDVIPVLFKHSRFHAYRSHQPVCVKEGTEAEAVKFRQQAVKPVFRFLKNQREMEDNKE